MPLVTGTRLGPYEIVAAVGAGGMGEVYRAKDTRLNRIVAIKVLPEHLSENPQLKQRFEREARTISSLSHPNICALYDIGHQNGTDYLVMEFLEGETLGHRLKRGALQTEQVLRIGIQISEALDKAHRQGIVHRDLKPGNIMLIKSGAKLLDFGLAKYEIKEDAHLASELETRDRPLTEEGVMLGTVQYMAPEQLEGKEADARTDIFALGQVLFEMSTGRHAFTGSSKASLISAIFSADPPPVSAIQPLAPAALDHLVKKCLAKDPDERWQSAHDVGSELKWISESTTATTMQAAVHPSRKILHHAWPFLSVLFLLSTLILAAILFFARPKTVDQTQQNLYKLSFLLPAGTFASSPGSIALSPDGASIAFVAEKDGISYLWIRRLDSFEIQQLPRTESAQYPFWSPDGRNIAFFSSGKLKKIGISGGTPTTLCSTREGRGGVWSTDNWILFAPTSNGELYEVPADGGAPKSITQFESNTKEQTHRWPYLLPDNEHFLYTIVAGDPDFTGIYIGSRKSKEKKRILSDRSRAIYVHPGYLLYMRENNLMAQAFDLKQLRPSGEAVVLGQDLDIDPGLATSSFTASQQRTLAFVNATATTNRVFWVDRTGKEVAKLIDKPASFYVQPTVSPDEKKVAVGMPDPAAGSYDIWIHDLERGTFSRFTFDQATDWESVWSPDSSRILFGSARGGRFNMFLKALGGPRKEEAVRPSAFENIPQDWSSDGRHILYVEEDPKTRRDLWVLPTFGERKPIPVLQSEFNEAHAHFSPDAKWIAYVSDETGRAEVYVDSFPSAVGNRRQVSTAGGDQPMWRKDSKELYYIAADRKLMAVEIKHGTTLEPGVITALFDTHFTYNTFPAGECHQYSVSADGSRFLVTNVTGSAQSMIHLITNWTQLLRK